MKSAGKVVNFTRNGSIVLRAKEAPRIGDFVVDKRSNRVGKIIRITGPVSSPYILVTNNVDDPEVLKSLPGRELFISDRRERPKQYRGKGGDRGKRYPPTDNGRSYKKYDGGKKGNFNRKPSYQNKGKSHSGGGKRSNRSKR